MRIIILFFSLLVGCSVLGQTTWTNPINVGSRWNNSNPILEVVNGFPAICHRSLGQDVMYRRALDACGDTWDTAINVSSLHIPGINTTGHPYMTIVDGHPAICFQNNTNSTFVYCRSDDQDGTSWTQFKIIETGGDKGSISMMTVVNGNPAIAYTQQATSSSNCNGKILYIRASDPQGNTWNAPVTLVSDQCNYWTPNAIELHILNGHPAVSLHLDSNTGPGSPWGAYFARANDADGTTWPNPELVFDGGWCNGFTVVNNKPNVLVHFKDGNTFQDSLGIAISTDSLGATWPGSLDKIHFGSSDIHSGRIHNFDAKVWVSAGIDGSPSDSLAFVSSPAVAPLTFGSQESITDGVLYVVGHDLNAVCGEIACVYLFSNYWYTRTDSPNIYYQDSDNDSFGNPNVSMTSSSQPTGYVLDNMDCDDTDPNITIPGASCDDGFACTTGTTIQADCSCGNPTNVNTSINTFLGITDLWMDSNNWSLNVIPEICHDVIIPANHTVRILTGEMGICFTLDVDSSTSFIIESGGELNVVTLGN